MSNNSFVWLPAETQKTGSSPNHALEIQGQLNSQTERNLVIVGMGARISDSNFTTLELQVAPILPDGTIGESTPVRYGRESNHSLEASGRVGCQEVVVGVGMRSDDENLTTLHLYARRLDARSGRLSSETKTYKFGKDPGHRLEVAWMAPEGAMTLITGVGARASDGDVTTLVLNTGNLTLA